MIQDPAVPPHSAEAVRPSRLFAIPVAITLVSGGVLFIGSPDKILIPAFILFVVAGWITSLCLHEYAHALTAYMGGDRGQASLGYLRLNPLRYNRSIISLLLPLAFLVMGGIGLPGGPIYINSPALRSRGWQSLVAAAGPAANLVIMLTLIGLLYLFSQFTHAHYLLGIGLSVLAVLQLTALILNLLPLPSMDGFGIIAPWLPPAARDFSTRYTAVLIVVLFLALRLIPPVHLLFANTILGLAGPLHLLPEWPTCWAAAPSFGPQVCLLNGLDAMVPFSTPILDLSS